MSTLAIPPLVGEIRMLRANFEMPGMMRCDGRALRRSRYVELHEAIGDTYGTAWADNAGLVLPKGEPTHFRIPLWECEHDGAEWFIYGGEPS